MLTSLVSMLTNAYATTKTQRPVQVTPKTTGYNPFAQENSNANPFMNSNFKGMENYAKNAPVQGGYFAGYYNGKPNIVGRKLFIEV